MGRIIILWILLVALVNGNLIEIKCPSLCKCDKFKGLRRASCLNKNIVTIEADIPKEVQILDMSFNQISDLEENIFEKLQYSELKLLNLSYNKISNIHMNAFRSLHSLKTIDLSHNYIQFILPHWFWHTKSLSELYLNNNNLFMIGNGQFESESLKVLDLSYCSLNQISIYALKKVPNLESLNLSGNHLTKLSVDLINTLPNLSKLNIANNTFKCIDDEIIEILDYSKAHHIETYDICDDPFGVKEEKFQRMIIEPPKIKKDDERNFWLYEDINDNNYVKSIVNNTCISHDEKENVLALYISPLWLICGLLIGFVLGVCSAFLISHRKKPKIIKKKPRIHSDFFRRNYNNVRLLESMHELSDTTPVLQRRTLF